MLRHDPRSSHATMTAIGALKPIRLANEMRTDVFDSLAQQVFCIVSEIRPRFVVRNMLRHDPRSAHAKTTAIGASKPLRFANTTRTDVFDSLAQQVFCLVSETRQRFLIRNMLRYDPRSSHATMTAIGASKPIRFANTARTDVFDSVTQQVFCLVSEIRPRFVVRNMLRHDPRSAHAKTTAIGASKPLRFANTTRTDVFDSLAQQVFCLVSETRQRFLIRNMLRYDPRSSHATMTAIGASKPIRFANTARTDVFDSVTQQVFCLVSEIRPRFVVRNMLRHDPRSAHAKTTAIGASKPLRFANTTRTDVFDSLAQQVFCLVSETRQRFLIRNMLRYDPRSSHATMTAIGASKPIRFANTARTDVFDSVRQQVFCLVIREGFLDPTAICCPEYVKT
ncbi:uncharacterized protein G2W53_007676 [Senna tora]|uniref:Uncharacterized protein n=1 Tax=Senna tora TaxID=362788 RepID=A0A834X7Q1_9FABA|nr:uncharacterized protein G2W53_007676 [Senna tora]